MRDMMPRVAEPELGPIASEVVYEDDHVRIWTHLLEPGQAGPLHRHELDYVIVDVGGDRIAAEPVPGSGGEYHEYIGGGARSCAPAASSGRSTSARRRTAR
jgi:hypothetical protein